MTSPRADDAATEADVLAANRRFYDQIAGVYDQVDSRRGDDLDHSWLLQAFEKGVVAPARESFGDRPLHLLDAGAGSGFLAVCTARLFGDVTLVDVSPRMLERIELPGARKLCGDVAAIPAADSSVDVVGAFATLHHLHGAEPFFAEAARVLRPGGVLYTDHDIEAEFARKLRWPLKLYRAACDHGHEYLSACPEADRESYELSEFHGEKGLEGPELARQLEAAGFDVLEEVYHWEGMGPVATTLTKLGLTSRLSRRGRAPVVRLIARRR